MIRKKLWFNLTCDRLLWLLHLSQLAAAWKYLYYAKLVFSVIFWFFFAKGHIHLFFVLLLSSSGAVWWTSQQVFLIHWQFHLQPVCLIWFTLIFYLEQQQFCVFLQSFLINWVHVGFNLRTLKRVLVLVICATDIFIANCLNLLVSLDCVFTAVFFVTITITRFTIFL